VKEDLAVCSEVQSDRCSVARPALTTRCTRRRAGVHCARQRVRGVPAAGERRRSAQ